MSLTAAVWPQFATQVFRGGIGRFNLYRKLCKWANNYVYISGAGNNMFETSYSDSYGRRLRVRSVHHEYGRLTLATAGLLLICRRRYYALENRGMR